MINIDDPLLVLQLLQPLMVLWCFHKGFVSVVSVRSRVIIIIIIINIIIIIIIIIIMKKVDKNRIYRQIEDGQNGWYK